MQEETNTLRALTAEIDSAFTPGGAAEIGMLTLKSANQTIEDASKRPDPEQLYLELWYEGEVCCLFADSNLGKSIFAVQMADEIALKHKVIYVDCELSDKQFQLRYCNPETKERHIFPDNLVRAEVNPYAIGAENYEDAIIRDIEAAAEKTGTKVIIIDNLTYLCNSSDKSVDAGIFMMKLMALKKKKDLSLLIIAHTPKRDLSSPITQNHLAGSKKLYNFFDSVFAIGMSAKDRNLRYVKQVKVRAGAFRYDAGNVLVYEIEKTNGFLRFNFREFATEEEHLRHRETPEVNDNEARILELSKQGLSCRKIADQVGLSKSMVNNIINKHKDDEQPLSTVQETIGHLRPHTAITFSPMPVPHPATHARDAEASAASPST